MMMYSVSGCVPRGELARRVHDKRARHLSARQVVGGDKAKWLWYSARTAHIAIHLAWQDGIGIGKQKSRPQQRG